MNPYYQDEQVTLYHADCLEVDAWLEADVLVTDPPYGIAWAPKKGGYRGAGSQTLSDPVRNDHSTAARDAALSRWGIKPRIVFGSWRAPRPEPVHHRLIWHKQGQAPGPATAPFMVQDEEIYVTGNGFKPSTPPLRSVITTYEPRSVFVAQIGHPTPKPVALIELLIQRCPDGVIADPFAGSGATLLAARNQGRRAIGVEIEERYCEIIAKRLDQLTFDFGELA